MAINNGQFKKGCIPWIKGKKATPEMVEKNRLSHLGKKHSESTKKKISNFQKGRERNPVTEETKQKMRKNSAHNTPLKGKTRTKKDREKMGEGRKRFFANGGVHPAWKGGKPKCIECGKRLSTYGYVRCSKCNRKYRSGENNSFWKGGISFEKYSVNWTKTLKRSIRERDGYICKVCGIPQNDITHVVHHVDYNKKNCDPMNLITLCRSCHSKTNTQRDYWIEYFKQNG